MPTGRAGRTLARLVAAATMSAASVTLLSACGTSSHVSTTPSPTLAQSPTTSTTPASSQPPTATATPTNTATATVSAGTKSASCVNGWVQPAAGSDFYQQATDALQASQGGTGTGSWKVTAVRYFAGPLVSGGIGAVYYLDVRDARLTARVLLVSGAGPSAGAIAKSGTTGWKQGDWHGFKGTDPPAVTPLPDIPHPGKWSGPAYDPVGGATPLLASSLAGCLDGS